MSRKGQSITLSLSEGDKKQLENLATEFGMTWGDKPNISKLVKAIATQQLRLVHNNNWSSERIQALERARNALIDLGRTDEAREIAQILHERSELNYALQAEINNFLHQPQSLWREKIDDFIRMQQPFRLSYRDASDRLLQYTVVHGRILPIEKRQYLACRCLEIEGNEDIAELSHNWTLRLDRIDDAAVFPLNEPWEKDLARVAVTFKLSSGLAFGYKDDSNEDIFIGDLEGDPPTRKVMRNIFSTFWFFRDIARYWDNCEIISPLNIRNKFREQLIKLNTIYEIRE